MQYAWTAVVVDENQSAVWLVDREQVEQSLALGLLHNEDDVLLEVRM